MALTLTIDSEELFSRILYEIFGVEFLEESAELLFNYYNKNEEEFKSWYLNDYWTEYYIYEINDTEKFEEKYGFEMDGFDFSELDEKGIEYLTDGNYVVLIKKGE